MHNLHIPIIMSSHTSEVVFEYTGFEDEVPEDVTCVHFHSSVPEVAEDMFKNCWQLKKVILNEGLQKETVNLSTTVDLSFVIRHSMQRDAIHNYGCISLD